MTSSNTRVTRHHVYFMVFVSVLTISLMSKSSFLYPLNDWVDSNCFFTVGKALLSGKVLYRDIFEQKGPLIYFLHALAARISYRSFLGMYFFEIFACFIFLYYSAKLFALFSDSGAKRGSLFSGDSAERFSLFSGDSAKRVSGADCIYYFIPVVSALTYSSAAFYHGDSVEEFFLPLITYSLYTGVTICLEEAIDYKKVFFTGICTGIVLWTKYTSLGFYIGGILVLSVYFLKQGKGKEVAKAALYYALGVLIVTLPVFIYFLGNNALADLYNTYFYNNMVLYSNRPEDHGLETGWGLNVLRGVAKAFQNNLALGLIIAAFIILAYRNINRKVYVLLIVTMFSSCLFIFKGTKSYNYYPLIFYSYLGAGLAFPLSWLYQWLGGKIKRFRGAAAAAVSVAVVSLLCLAGAMVRSPNTYMLLEKKENLPQYKFAKIIEEGAVTAGRGPDTTETVTEGRGPDTTETVTEGRGPDTTEMVSEGRGPDTSPDTGVTLLNYGFLDGGFYTATGIVPDYKYFCRMNIPLEEMINAQEDYLNSGSADYVVTRDQEINLNKYNLVSQASYIFEGREWLYRLYKLDKDE